MVGPGQWLARADSLAIGCNRGIAGEHQMVAVVDHQPKRRVAVRAAASAGLGGAVTKRNRHARICQYDSSRKPCQPRPGNEDARRAQRRRLKRSSDHSSASFETGTRRRGDRQPCMIMRWSRRE